MSERMTLYPFIFNFGSYSLGSRGFLRRLVRVIDELGDMLLLLAM
jgi:hypothetical protein